MAMLRPGGKLGITWDSPVEHFFLYDLRENYTQFVMSTGSRVAESRARDATQWMRENAPWKDRTVEERVKAKTPDPYGPNARQSLIAYVGEQGTAEERRMHAIDTKVAQRSDKRALTALNRQRRKAGQIEMSQLPKAMRTSVTPLPARGPIAEVHFEHGDRRRIPYAIWLEIAHGGKYSILAPAVSYWGAKMMSDIQRIINLGHLSGAEYSLGEQRMGPDFVRGPKGSRIDDDYDISKVSSSRLSSERSLRDVGYTRSGYKRRSR